MNFHTSYDVYKNEFVVDSSKYKNKLLSFKVKKTDNILFEEVFTNTPYIPNVNLTDFDEVVIEISDNEHILYQQEFRFRYKYGVIKMPLIRVANSMGVGDYMMITPVMKKLHSIYKQKITLCLPLLGSHSTLTNDYFREFIEDNPDFNSISYWTLDNVTVPDPENKYDFFHVFEADWNSYYYSDLKQLCASKCGLTLKDDELDTIYNPKEFETIILPYKYVCINPCIRGPERSWNKEQWQKLVDDLNDVGIPVVSIGKDSGEDVKPYYKLDIKIGLDLAGDPCQNSLSQTWHIINKSEMLITFDTGIYLFAGTTDTHIILCGWPGDPYYHQSYRHGSKFYKFSHVRGGCKEYCLTDPKWDINEHGTIRSRHASPFCELYTNFSCKPSAEQVFKEVIKIKISENPYNSSHMTRSS